MTVISLPAPWTPLERCDEAVAAARPGIWATFVPPGFDVGRHRLRPPRKLCGINGDVFLRCMYDSDAEIGCGRQTRHLGHFRSSGFRRRPTPFAPATKALRN